MTTLQTDTTLTPMMQQWHECKQKAKGALLLFRLGDFYEAFYEDAAILSKELDLTLTKRQDTPMSGIPFHASDNYIDKLIARGYRVAIAEQMEDPKATKGLVKRDIVRIMSPGSVITSGLLEEKSHNYLVSIALVNKIFGISLLDITTGTFTILEVEEEKNLLDELAKFHPKEVLFSEKAAKLFPELVQEIKRSFTQTVLTLPDSLYDLKLTTERLRNHFGVHSLDGFGISAETTSLLAAGALLTYVCDDLCLNLSHVRTIKKHESGLYMAIDRATQKHLELFSSLRKDDVDFSLLHFMDYTETPMGGRKLKQVLQYPLLSLAEIIKRQDAVEALLPLVDRIRPFLSKIRDLERLIMRIETNYASPKDLLALADSLDQLPLLSESLSLSNSTLIQELSAKLVTQTALTAHIRKALVTNPPLKLSDGNVFAKGYNASLDELKEIQEEVSDWMSRYQNKLKEDSGIKTLKVGYTKAFGFYIEVSKAAAKEVPPSFFRRQTLVNAERFITDELKAFEYKLLHAEERIKALEAELFSALRERICQEREAIRSSSEAVALLDVLFSFATLSIKERYVRPLIDESNSYEIEEGRHPIVEKNLGMESFIPNPLCLNERERMMVITGPNMAGKSTYIRQVALIAIMAQAGCFVPAKRVRLGILDKVFSRIGASDDISRGQSTFMVEMSETANILNNATPRSLIILDEIGRGTSTYDGVSIAWAVADFLLNHPKGAPKTLFATHYFELTALESELKGAVNYNVAVHESASGIVFLRKIVKGGTDKSYGIHVARLAGLPSSVIHKAESILKKLEKQQKLSKPKKEESLELPLFAPPPLSDGEVIQELKALKVEAITPLQALEKLYHWKQKLKKS